MTCILVFGDPLDSSDAGCLTQGVRGVGDGADGEDKKGLKSELSSSGHRQ